MTFHVWHRPRLTPTSKAAPAADTTKNSSGIDEQAGVGLKIELKNGHFLVKNFVPGCPAGKSPFIKIGDEIKEIRPNTEGDWISVEGLSLEKVEQLIRGDVDKPVSLECWRGPEKKVAVLVRQKNCPQRAYTRSSLSQH